MFKKTYNSHWLSLCVGVWLTTLVAGASTSSQQYAFGEGVHALEYGEKFQVSWSTEQLERSEQRVYLDFHARIHAGNFNTGSAYALKVYVNRVPVTIDRLVNKQTQWLFGIRRYIFWMGGDNAITLLYHDWQDESERHGRLHRFVYDITALLREEGENSVVWESIYDAIPGSVVEIKDIRLQVGGEISRNPLPKVEEPFYLSEPFAEFRERATSLHAGSELILDTSPDFKEQAITLNAKNVLESLLIDAEFTESGDLNIHMDGFDLVSRLQLGTKGNGWQYLGSGAWRGERVDERRWRFSNGNLSIEREVIFFEYGITISDRVKNHTSQDLPLGVLYELERSEQNDLKEFRVFGEKIPSFHVNTKPTRASGITPSVFLSNEQGAFGVVVEDDILRNQASYMAWDRTLGVGTDMFYLKPGATHEFVWSLIPANDAGYYDFLNKVRAKWQTYQKIPGLFGFVYPDGQDKRLDTPEKVAAFFENTGIDIPCIPPATSRTPTKEGGVRMVYGNEPMSMIREVLEGVNEFITKARAGGVTYPFLLYTDVHLVRTDGSKEVLKELEDSIIVDYKGNPVEYREGWLYNLLPTENTSAGKRFNETLEAYMDTPGVKGIFLDEWDHSRARYTFNHEDGLTAQLDADFNIIKKIGIVPLMTKQYQRQVVDSLLAQDAVIFANQFDSTHSSLSLPIVHFAEPTQYTSYLLRAAQMSRTPLSLTVKRSKGTWLDAQEFLKMGVLTCYYARRLTGDHMLRHIYPITVRSTGPGYVIGDGKIVTLASGAYSFGDQRSIQAKVFGGENGRYLRTVESQGLVNGKSVLNLILDRGAEEAAVIVPID